MKITVIHQQGPYRYIDCGLIGGNDRPDYRLQERDEYTNKFTDIYLFDNQQQMFYAIEDYDYTLWLAGKPCYLRDEIKAPYS